MAIANSSIYYTWKNIKSEYKNNKFKISGPTWNDTFDLPDLLDLIYFLILLWISKIALNLSTKNTKL